ncbi:hypothetical protein [Sphingopyxis sp. JAI128]|uniref:hypothetical protein n=1 Tax=Sphingopyxis sp. JAI128 TaxID=2723066 RepID=UPI00161015D5|nr:hypothetical protein [Sphingopyxis sp. JAI128]
MTEIGTSWMLSARLFAVTTISNVSSVCAGAAFAVASPDCWASAAGAHIKAVPASNHCDNLQARAAPFDISTLPHECQSFGWRLNGMPKMILASGNVPQSLSHCQFGMPISAFCVQDAARRDGLRNIPPGCAGSRQIMLFHPAFAAIFARICAGCPRYRGGWRRGETMKPTMSDDRDVLFRGLKRIDARLLMAYLMDDPQRHDRVGHRRSFGSPYRGPCFENDAQDRSRRSCRRALRLTSDQIAAEHITFGITT